MFIPDGASEAGALRQGDVLGDVQLAGAINLKNLTEAAPGGGRPVSWTVHEGLRRGPVAVLSHCCEIDPTNGVKLTGITLAPIRDASSATEASKLAELIESNIITDAATASYLKYFYLNPDQRIGLSPKGYVVDFSKCFTFHRSAYEQLLASKRVQLTDEIRAAFSLKLGLFYHRLGKVSAPPQQESAQLS